MGKKPTGFAKGRTITVETGTFRTAGPESPAGSIVEADRVARKIMQTKPDVSGSAHSLLPEQVSVIPPKKPKEEVTMRATNPSDGEGRTPEGARAEDPEAESERGSRSGWEGLEEEAEGADVRVGGTEKEVSVAKEETGSAEKKAGDEEVRAEDEEVRAEDEEVRAEDEEVKTQKKWVPSGRGEELLEGPFEGLSMGEKTIVQQKIVEFSEIYSDESLSEDERADKIDAFVKGLDELPAKVREAIAGAIKNKYNFSLPDVGKKEPEKDKTEVAKEPHISAKGPDVSPSVRPPILVRPREKKVIKKDDQFAGTGTRKKEEAMRRF